jgi:flagellin
MAMSIRTNVSSLNAQRSLFKAGADLDRSMQRLSSGFRINSSADDAAGLAVSEKLKAQIGGLNQAARNALDGISMIQTAEGALDEIQSSLQRMRDLSVQAANASLSDSDRGNINQEIQALYTNINNISARTKFNGQSLLTGALSTSQDTAAANALLVGKALTTTAANASVSAIDTTKALAGTAFTLSTSGGNLRMSATINGAAVTQDIAVVAMTAGQTQTFNFSTFGVSLSLSATGAKAAADILTDLSTAGNAVITTAAGSGSAAFQVGADASQTESATFFNTQISGTNFAALNTAITNYGAGTSTVAEANALNSALDTTISSIVTSRAALGASQNSLEHTMNNVKVTSDNLAASNSRIRDVDVAEESSAMSRAQIISQSAVSVLAQANQMPQLALKLLG